MTLIAWCCFAIAALIVGSMVGQKTDPISPIRLFLLIWLTALGLADLKLSGYQHVWSAFAWLVLIITIFSFLLGILTNHVLWLQKPRLTIAEVRLRLKNTVVDERFLAIVIVVFVCLYAISIVSEVALVGYIPLFSSRPDVARVEFGIFGIHLFVTLMPTILYLIAEYVILVPGKKRRKVLFVILGGIVVLTFFTLLQRFLLMMAALLIFALVFYSSRKIRFRHVVVAGVVLLGFLVAIQQVRLTRYVQNYIFVISKMKFSSEFAVFTEPYMYLAMNLENFTRAVSQLEFHTYGYFSADAVMALSGLKHWLAEYFGIVERPFLNSGYNTFPLFWTYYYDFGILGVTLIPWILGVIVGAAYNSLRSNPTLTSLVAYAICFFSIVVSLTTNPLSMLTTVSNLVLLLALHIHLSARTRRASQSVPA